MPEWLLKDENYTPQTDKDTFINKSILSLLNIISKIKTQGGQKDKFYVSAVFKVLFTFMLVILISVSKNFSFIMIAGVYLLVLLSLMEAQEIITVLKISLVFTLFSFVILLPAAFWGNQYSAVMITSKVFETIVAVNILSHSTRWTSITSALKRFFVPDIFIFVLDITIKYILMLGDFTLNMLYSLKLRSVGKNRNKYTSLSGIAGTMFIKSKEMAEEMYCAMECRGFTGEYRIYSRFRITLADFIYIIINAGILSVFIYLHVI
jgi:cobalt/nickel transport system permease protein